MNVRKQNMQQAIAPKRGISRAILRPQVGQTISHARVRTLQILTFLFVGALCAGCQSVPFDAELAGDGSFYAERAWVGKCTIASPPPVRAQSSLESLVVAPFLGPAIEVGINAISTAIRKAAVVPEANLHAVATLEARAKKMPVPLAQALGNDSCLLFIAGRFVATPANERKFPGSTSKWNTSLADKGIYLSQPPSLVLEAWLVPSHNGQALKLVPGFLLYTRHLARSLFRTATEPRNLAISIIVASATETNVPRSNFATITFGDVVPSNTPLPIKLESDHYFHSSPWVSLPEVKRGAPVNLIVNVSEVGESSKLLTAVADIFDKGKNEFTDAVKSFTPEARANAKESKREAELAVQAAATSAQAEAISTIYQAKNAGTKGQKAAVLYAKVLGQMKRANIAAVAADREPPFPPSQLNNVKDTLGNLSTNVLPLAKGKDR